jgi:hypothetical protein
MSPQFIVLFFFARLLGGLLCGALLYAGVALTRARNDDSSPAEWRWAGWTMIAVVTFIYAYDLGLFVQIVALAKFAPRFGAVFVIAQILWMLFGLCALAAGYLWGRRVYRIQLRAALEEGTAFGPGAPAATA